MSQEKQQIKSAAGKSYEKANVAIVVKEGNFDKTFAKFKQRVKSSKIMNEVYERMQYTKPSAKRREEIQNAKMRQKTRNVEE